MPGTQIISTHPSFPFRCYQDRPQGYPSASTILAHCPTLLDDIFHTSCSSRTDSVAEQICSSFPTQISLPKEPPTSSSSTDRYIPRWGCPLPILSDNGRPFSSQLAVAILALLKVRRVTTTAYQPSGNGVVERVNHTMAHMLSIYIVVNERQDDWDLHLPHPCRICLQQLGQRRYRFSSKPRAYGTPPAFPTYGLRQRLRQRAPEPRQSLARDHLEYCQLAVDRQQRRSYDLVREPHLLTVVRINQRNSSLSNALYKTPDYKIGDRV